MKGKTNKIFEYRPQGFSPPDSEESVKQFKKVLEIEHQQRPSYGSNNESDINIENLDNVIDHIMEEEGKSIVVPRPYFEHEAESNRQSDEDQPHHRQTSSNSNFGIEKCDNLNIEKLLEDGEGDDQFEMPEELKDKFGGHFSHQFLHDFNREFKKDTASSEEIKYWQEANSSEKSDTQKEFVEFDTSNQVEDKQDEKTAIDFVSKSQPMVDHSNQTKPSLDSIDPLPKADPLFTKSDPSAVQSAFSPQNLVAKLLNSLNSRSDEVGGSTDMLIYDDDTTPTPKPGDKEESKSEKESDNCSPDKNDSPIMSGTQSLSPRFDYSKEEQHDEIVDCILNQLVNEVKESLFPDRGSDDYNHWQHRDPSYNTTSLRKLAFESNRGIPTDFMSIDGYLKEVIDEIIKNEGVFINNILTPIQRNPVEMLHLLRTSDIGSYSHFDTYDYIVPILGVEIYLEIEKRKEQDRQEMNAELSDESQSVAESLIGECEHINNKNIFDSINESLNQFRPYGKEGVPMPWSNKLRKLREDEILEFSKMFEIIKQDLFRWNYTSAGTLPKREFLNEHGAFDEDYFGEIREKRLAALLASDVMENEYKWVNYDFEESQVKIDVGDMILEHIITETINILKSLGKPYRGSSIYSDSKKISEIFNILPLQNRLEAEGISLPIEHNPEAFGSNTDQ